MPAKPYKQPTRNYIFREPYFQAISDGGRGNSALIKNASHSGRRLKHKLKISGLFQFIPCSVVFFEIIFGLDLDDELDDETGAEDQGNEYPAEDDVGLE